MEYFLDHMPGAMIDDMAHPCIRSPGQMLRNWHSLLACWRQGTGPNRWLGMMTTQLSRRT